MIKLYIGNLSYDITEPALREALSSYEPIVDLHLPLDRDTGQPRGFAFVTFGNRETGEKALKELDGSTLGDRRLRVDEAEDRGPRRGPAERSPRVSMDIDDVPRVDDRPVGPDGKKVRYKGI